MSQDQKKWRTPILTSLPYDNYDDDFDPRMKHTSSISIKIEEEQENGENERIKIVDEHYSSGLSKSMANPNDNSFHH